MVKTNQEIEKFIIPLFKILGFPTSEHKWVALRFMINISLSINKNYKVDDYLRDGGEYELKQLTGQNKLDEDFTNLYKNMIEIYDNTHIKNQKELEKKLEYHINRGFQFLKPSIQSGSNIHDFMLEEFFNPNLND